jgi:hypothetical protein
MTGSTLDLDLAERVTEIDIDGYVDARGIRYLGRAKKMDDGTWRCVADVSGSMCLVEVKITIGGAQ